jgi:lysophospholipase L1-like esterase
MTTTMRVRLAVLLTALALLAGMAAPTASADTAQAVPSRMASLGDSITRGFNSCGWFFDCTSRSWSTGSGNGVNSHFERLQAIDPTMGTAYNRARTGARVDELASQAQQAKRDKAGYVTILIGANDACTSSESTMTSLADFQSHVDAAFSELQKRGAAPLTFVSTIPDIYQLWKVGKDSSAARTAWSSYGICQSMLKDPLDESNAAEARRQRVRERVEGFNAILTTTCDAHDFCTHDNGAVFGYAFQLDHLSGWDYFHPNTAGQNILADVTWQHTFTWTTGGGDDGGGGNGGGGGGNGKGPNR